MLCYPGLPFLPDHLKYLWFRSGSFSESKHIHVLSVSLLTVTAYHFGNRNSGEHNCIIRLQHNWAFDFISTENSGLQVWPCLQNLVRSEVWKAAIMKWQFNFPATSKTQEEQLGPRLRRLSSFQTWKSPRTHMAAARLWLCRPLLAKCFHQAGFDNFVGL